MSDNSDNSVPLSGDYNLEWVDARDGDVPRGAVVGGYERSGETLYVARAEYRGALTPGKLASSQRGASVSWGGQEHRLSRYQVVPLSGDYNLEWVDARDGDVPRGAVVGGYERSGETLYVARAEYRGALTPGKLASSQRGASVSWGGQEHRLSRYQVLVGNVGPYNWVKTCGSNIPREAFRGGVNEDGETLYIGRVQHECTLTPGKVARTHGVCYIAFDGRELSFSQYEILTF